MKKLVTILFILMCLCQARAITILSGPYLQNVTESEATIVWRTDSDALSWVEIASESTDSFYAESHPRYYATSMGRALIGKLHKIKINNLAPNTTYRYRIISREVLTEEPYYVAYGATAATDVYMKEPLKFTTPGPGESLEFLVVNDMHADNDKFSGLMKNFRKGETDFVLLNGDMVSYMDSENQLFEGFIDKAVELFASETPFFMVRGNHESRGKFAQKYMDYFPTATGKPFYAVKQGPVFFIFLDGGEDKPDDSIEYYGTAFGDDYRAEQAEWLKAVVECDEFKNALYRVVVCHIPPVGDTWHGPRHAKKLWLPILNKSGIDLMLCGHLHSLEFHDKGFEGAEFPVLVNSNEDVVKVSVNPTSLVYTVIDQSGKTVLSRQVSSK